MSPSGLLGALGMTAVLLTACPREKGPLGGFAEPPGEGEPVKDPVTGQVCAKGPDVVSAVFENRTFYFCQPAHLAQFLQDPEDFAYR